MALSITRRIDFDGNPVIVYSDTDKVFYRYADDTKNIWLYDNHDQPVRRFADITSLDEWIERVYS